jgi:hypothetical protein
VQGNQVLIQLLNIGVPVLAVVLFGIGRAWMRRRKNKKLQA